MTVSAYGTTPTYTGLNYLPLLNKQYRTYFRREIVLRAIFKGAPSGTFAKGFGDTLRIPILPDIRSEKRTLGQPVSWNYATPTSIDLVIDQLRGWNFTVLDVHRVQSQIPNFEGTWGSHVAKNTKEDIEQEVIADVIDDADASNMGATAGKETASYNLGTAAAPREVATSTGANDIVDRVLEFGAVLDEQDVPNDGRWMVVNPWGYMKLKSALRNANEMGDGTSTLRNGKVGDIDRFGIYVCNRLPDVANVNGKPVIPILFGQKEAGVFHIQMENIEKLRLQDVHGDGHRSELLYGWKIVHPTALGVAYWTPAS